MAFSDLAPRFPPTREWHGATFQRWHGTRKKFPRH